MFDDNIPVSVFTSYAHKDEELRDIVKKELPEYEILLEDNNKELMLALLPKDEADEKGIAEDSL